MEGGIKCGRSTLIDRIENCTLDITDKIVKNQSPAISVRNSKDWKNCCYKEWLTLKIDATETTTSFLNSKERFTRVLHMLNKLYQLLISNSQCSLRQLYYDDVELYESQRQTDDILNFICKKLDCMPTDLGVFPNSKGLLAGPLRFRVKSDQHIDCSKNGGTKIPDVVGSISQIESGARFILVVEKETAFRKLLDEDIFNKLGPCILITGRGFPDLNTRQMLKILWEKLEIPVLALVDCDPHGIEIMLVYRFGSLSQSQFGEILAVPSMKWLGVQPRDVINLQIPSIPLTIEEKGHLGAMCERQYLKSNPQLLHEVRKMIESSSKAEIESLYNFSPSYLTNVYLPNKIHSNEYF